MIYLGIGIGILLVAFERQAQREICMQRTAHIVGQCAAMFSRLSISQTALAVAFRKVAAAAERLGAAMPRSLSVQPWNRKARHRLPPWQRP